MACQGSHRSERPSRQSFATDPWFAPEALAAAPLWSVSPAPRARRPPRPRCADIAQNVPRICTAPPPRSEAMPSWTLKEETSLAP